MCAMQTESGRAAGACAPRRPETVPQLYRSIHNPLLSMSSFCLSRGDALTIELIRNWLWELAAGFGCIVISVCYVMNAGQQLLYGCTFSYGESLLQLVPET